MELTPGYPPMGERLAELRRIAEEESYVLIVDERRDRPNAFAATLDDLPG